MTEYPEHAKLEDVPHDDKEAIAGFLMWLRDETDVRLCTADGPDHKPFVPWDLAGDIEAILCEYYGIDQDALAEEKAQKLEEFREEQGLA